MCSIFELQKLRQNCASLRETRRNKSSSDWQDITALSVYKSNEKSNVSQFIIQLNHKKLNKLVKKLSYRITNRWDVPWEHEATFCASIQHVRDPNTVSVKHNIGRPEEKSSQRNIEFPTLQSNARVSRLKNAKRVPNFCKSWNEMV
jgi:hypothetical protein